MFQTIMLATDGSAPAERAAALTISLARRYAARVIVVHACGPPPDEATGLRLDKVLDERWEEAGALLQDTARRMRELGVAEVTTDLTAGPAADAILRCVELYRPDLLVIGARGRSPWVGLALGSVSLAVTQQAPCPVLVVK